MREREIAAADAAAKTGASGGAGGGSGGDVKDSAFASKVGGGTGATPSTGAKRKAAIAKRIGAPR